MQNNKHEAAEHETSSFIQFRAIMKVLWQLEVRSGNFRGTFNFCKQKY